MIPEVIHGTPVRVMARVQIAAAVFSAHIGMSQGDTEDARFLARESWRLADRMLEEEPRAAFTEKQLVEQEKAAAEAKEREK